MGGLQRSPLGILGESGSDNLSFMPRLDSDKISLTGAGTSALSGLSGLYGLSSVKPRLRKPGKIETTPPIPEAEAFSSDVSSNISEVDKDGEKEDCLKENE